MTRTLRRPPPAFALRPLCCVFVLVAPGVLAQDTVGRLDDVVVTAAGFEQKITDAPASISVISKEELARKPYTSLVDAVRELEGVDVGETSDKTGQKTISMRGMGADYTLVLIDGKRQSNHGDIYPNNFGGNQFNHIPPMDAIERVEVIRGPASTLYGADALGGVINIITKKDTTEWTGSMTYGRIFPSDDDFGDESTADFSVRGPLIPGTLSMSLRGSVYDRDASNPDYKATRTPDGELRERSLGFGGGGRTVDNTNKAYGLSLYFTPDERERISFDYDTSNQKYDNAPETDANGNPSFPLGTVDSAERLWSASRAGYGAGQEFEREAWSLSHEGRWTFGTSFVALSYVESDNNGRTLPLTVTERQQLDQLRGDWGNVDFAELSDEQREQIADGFLPRPKRTLQSNQYTLDARLDIPLTALSADHLLVVGGQIIDGELEDSVFGMEDGSPGKAQKHKMWSVFVEDNWMPNERFTLTAGVRHDDHDTFGSQVSPRLYGVYMLDPLWTLKGGVSTGYKTPKTTDLYDGITGFGGQGTIPFAGNPDLEPETSLNSEFAVYWNHPARHSFNATIFHNNFKDKIMRGEAVESCEVTGGVRPCVNLGDYIDLGYDSFSQVINVDKAVIQGLELAGRWQIDDRWALRGNYTYTDSEQKTGADNGMPLTNSAKHMLNTTLDWQPRADLLVFLTMEARTERYRGKINGKAAHYEDYEVFHLGAVYQVDENFTITGRVNNLFDKDFTSYRWARCEGGRGCDGGWQALDDYNNKDKARSFWVSANYRF